MSGYLWRKKASKSTFSSKDWVRRHFTLRFVADDDDDDEEDDDEDEEKEEEKEEEKDGNNTKSSSKKKKKKKLRDVVAYLEWASFRMTGEISIVPLSWSTTFLVEPCGTSFRSDLRNTTVLTAPLPLLPRHHHYCPPPHLASFKALSVGGSLLGPKPKAALDMIK